ncbi:MAG TPA: phosphopantetheine-binding protein [Ilumatobacteraceae bacterium]|nr:phosphopantetheine-binding protein [Ilumatobacteraceae bacterium]
MNDSDNIHTGAHDSVDLVTMILSAIADVAPELEPELADLDHDVDFWTELQLDSMDHLSVMTRLADQTGVEIAERDYPRLTTVAALRDFLAENRS